jgi:hypothetical protein
MTTPIVRQDSALFALTVELFLRHQRSSTGDCRCCHRPACFAGPHATTVIWAAGVDPALLRPPPRRPEAVPWADQPTVPLPVYRKEPPRP